jgi:hypothetical protein
MTEDNFLITERPGMLFSSDPSTDEITGETLDPLQTIATRLLQNKVSLEFLNFEDAVELKVYRTGELILHMELLTMDIMFIKITPESAEFVQEALDNWGNLKNG